MFVLNSEEQKYCYSCSNLLEIKKYLHVLFDTKKSIFEEALVQEAQSKERWSSWTNVVTHSYFISGLIAVIIAVPLLDWYFNWSIFTRIKGLFVSTPQHTNTSNDMNKQVLSEINKLSTRHDADFKHCNETGIETLNIMSSLNENIVNNVDNIRKLDSNINIMKSYIDSNNKELSMVKQIVTTIVNQYITDSFITEMTAIDDIKKEQNISSNQSVIKALYFALFKSSSGYRPTTLNKKTYFFPGKGRTLNDDTDND